MSKTPAALLVKARIAGHYGRIYREPGDQFLLDDEKAFSHKWMIPMGWRPAGYKEPTAKQKTPRRRDELTDARRQNEKLLARIAELEASAGAAPSGADPVAGEGPDKP